MFKRRFSVTVLPASFSVVNLNDLSFLMVVFFAVQPRANSNTSMFDEKAVLKANILRYVQYILVAVTNTTVNGISPGTNTLKAGSTSAVDDCHGKAGVLKSRRAIESKNDRKRKNEKQENAIGSPAKQSNPSKQNLNESNWRKYQ